MSIYSLASLPHLCLENVIKYLDKDTALSLRITCSTLCEYVTYNQAIIATLMNFKTIFAKEYNEIESNKDKGGTIRVIFEILIYFLRILRKYL
jgi:hypothetical protein